MATTIRIDPKRETRLKRAALRRGLSKSEYIRSAIDEKLERDDPPVRSWEMLKELAGKFDLGDPELSHRDPREIIRAKYRAKHGRRAR